MIYLSTYVDTYVSSRELLCIPFHSIPLPFTSIPLHYITLYLCIIYIYIYIRIYVYIILKRERESWIYLVLRYYAIHGLPVSYDNYVQDMHLLFFIRAMAPPRRSNVSTPRSGRFAALRSGTTSALSSTWRHSPTWRHDNMHLSLW